MVNDTKGLNILWVNFRGGSILLTKPSFSIPSMTFTNMLAMWFFGGISKIIRPCRMLRAKDVQHVKGGKQKLSNMKSLVKQVISAVGIASRHDLVFQNWSPRKVMDLYLGVRHFLLFLACPVIRGDAMKKSHGRHISMRCRNGRANYLGTSDVISRAGGIGLVLQY